jgi:hypothetical protein
MGAQRLNARSIRRIAFSTGLNVTRGWSHGGYTLSFFVPDPDHPHGHRHGWFDKKTGNWGWDTSNPPMHYTSCKNLEEW